MSAKIGIAFAAKIAAAEAEKLKGVVIISSPGFKFKANIAVVIPEVAELTDIENLL